MRLDDRPADRQTEARALDRLLRGVRRAEEALEEVLLLFLRDAGARVRDLDHDRAKLLARPHLDVAARRGELDRIRDEVVEQLRDPHLVPAHDDRPVHGADELDAARLCNGQGGNDAIAAQRADVDRRQLDLELACVVARDEEQVADEPLQPA